MVYVLTSSVEPVSGQLRSLLTAVGSTMDFRLRIRCAHSWRVDSCQLGVCVAGSVQYKNPIDSKPTKQKTTSCHVHDVI